MTIDNRGRFEPTANVRHMRWAENPGDERRDGLRVGYGRAFCFVPNGEVMNLATALLDWIQLNRDTINQSSTGN